LFCFLIGEAAVNENSLNASLLVVSVEYVAFFSFGNFGPDYVQLALAIHPLLYQADITSMCPNIASKGVTAALPPTIAMERLSSYGAPWGFYGTAIHELPASTDINMTLSKPPCILQAQ
jgi:hypothetical protein